MYQHVVSIQDDHPQIHIGRSLNDYHRKDWATMAQIDDDKNDS
jgi:hypothetical protein